MAKPPSPLAPPTGASRGRPVHPTVREVELRLAALEGTDDAVLIASGMAAMSTTLLAMTRAGDHVVLFRDCYRRTRQFVSATLGRFGVSHSLVAEDDLRALAEVLHPRTRVVLAEALSLPSLASVDIAALGTICRAPGHAGPRLVVDATLASPVNLRPASLGADLVIHSASRYLADHPDVVAGVVCGPASLVAQVRDLRGVLGTTCDPHAASLVGRGLATLSLRVARQNATARAVAEVLASHARAERVHYPLLASHPSHDVAARQLRGGGSLVTFVLRGGRAAASRFVGAFHPAPSPGGVETLAEHPAVTTYPELDDEQLAIVGVPPGLVRLSVGLEDTADVVARVLAALA